MPGTVTTRVVRYFNCTVRGGSFCGPRLLAVVVLLFLFVCFLCLLTYLFILFVCLLWWWLFIYLFCFIFGCFFLLFECEWVWEWANRIQLSWTSVLKVSYFRLSLTQTRTGAVLIACSCSAPVFNPAVTFCVHNKVSKISSSLFMTLGQVKNCIEWKSKTT